MRWELNQTTKGNSNNRKKSKITEEERRSKHQEETLSLETSNEEDEIQSMINMMTLLVDKLNNMQQGSKKNRIVKGLLNVLNKLDKDDDEQIEKEDDSSTIDTAQVTPPNEAYKLSNEGNIVYMEDVQEEIIIETGIDEQNSIYKYHEGELETLPEEQDKISMYQYNEVKLGGLGETKREKVIENLLVNNDEDDQEDYY